MSLHLSGLSSPSSAFISITQSPPSGAVKVIPLAFVRGRTFNDTFIIVDEAQNSSIHELKIADYILCYCLCLIISNKVTPHATETFSESPMFFIGIFAFLSTILRIPWLIPLSSEPNIIDKGLLSL